MNIDVIINTLKETDKFFFIGKKPTVIKATIEYLLQTDLLQQDVAKKHGCSTQSIRNHQKYLACLLEKIGINTIRWEIKQKSIIKKKSMKEMRFIEFCIHHGFTEEEAELVYEWSKNPDEEFPVNDKYGYEKWWKKMRRKKRMNNFEVK